MISGINSMLISPPLGDSSVMAKQRQKTITGFAWLSNNKENM